MFSTNQFSEEGDFIVQNEENINTMENVEYFSIIQVSRSLLEFCLLTLKRETEIFDVAKICVTGAQKISNATLSYMYCHLALKTR